MTKLCSIKAYLYELEIINTLNTGAITEGNKQTFDIRRCWNVAGAGDNWNDRVRSADQTGAGAGLYPFLAGNLCHIFDTGLHLHRPIGAPDHQSLLK